jgi:hypothetical protein
VDWWWGNFISLFRFVSFRFVSFRFGMAWEGIVDIGFVVIGYGISSLSGFFLEEWYC